LYKNNFKVKTEQLSSSHEEVTFEKKSVLTTRKFTTRLSSLLNVNKCK